MKTLILVRHGDVRRDSAVMTDLECPLTVRGHCETAGAASEFVSRGQPVDLIVSSPAQRALESADIWRKALRLPEGSVQVIPEIYEAERAGMQAIIRQLPDEADSVVLVGHNPGVTALLHYLTGRGIEKMTLSSFSIISLDVSGWRYVALRDTELAYFYAPPVGVKSGSFLQRFRLWRQQRGQKVELTTVLLLSVVFVLVAVAVFLIVTSGTGK